MIEKIPQITIRAARVNAGLSQLEAAKKLNISVRMLQKYEGGEVVPQWDTVQAMSCLYDIHTDFLFLSKKFAKSDCIKQ